MFSLVAPFCCLFAACVCSLCADLNYTPDEPDPSAFASDILSLAYLLNDMKDLVGGAKCRLSYTIPATPPVMNDIIGVLNYPEISGSNLADNTFNNDAQTCVMG